MPAARMLFILLFFATSAFASGLTGTYTGETPKGKISLILKQAGEKLTGTFSAEDGTVYQLVGEGVDNDAFGSLRSDRGELYFELFLDEDTLYFDVMPMAEDGEPDDEEALEYELVPKKEDRPGKKPEPAAVAADRSALFSGAYSGSIQTTPARMTLYKNGPSVSGQIDAGGYIYNLVGKLQGDRVQGTLSDPQTGGSMTFEATEKDGTLTLKLTGQASGVSYQFRKGSASTAPSNP